MARKGENLQKKKRKIQRSIYKGLRFARKRHYWICLRENLQRRKREAAHSKSKGQTATEQTSHRNVC